ncbi:hypothetical protein SteCoe_19685 [Stentor coeruleus]|uniref:Saposin B-type domain-containing protein n=1 Tax=Stentor coeruleus TaxID=5963 RepID=A0A1R2BTK5_9CILI|nr:hypothetical protein SteCoe_19685 [Stentor coeruleus]
MKSLLLLTIAFTVWSLSGCDHCVRLSQFNFDYVPLLQDGYCENDKSCENFLREVAYRYLSGKIEVNPCINDLHKPECSEFSMHICSEILQSSCSKGFLAPDPGLNHVETLQEQLQKLDEESAEVEEELKQEIARQKQKYLRIINRLSELQLGM